MALAMAPMTKISAEDICDWKQTSKNTNIQGPSHLVGP